MDSSPTTHPTFHAGELAVQERVGVRERIAEPGARMIRDAMPAQHREFFEKLPMIVVGSLDDQRRPWASVLVGQPGFMQTPDDRHLRIGASALSCDVLALNLEAGAPLGLLGIEPHTRRRNRMNGTVEQIDERGFTVAVDQSFGNCPQYIQAREPSWTTAASPPMGQLLGARLNDAARQLVRRSDTLFIASASPEARGAAGKHGVDVSHRGGKPGFVRVDVEPATSKVSLTIPDFRGNFMFNTLGNIAANPRAGLVFFDPATGDVLQTTGTAEIIWDGPEVEAFAGAQRLLRVHIDESRWLPGALPLRWSAPKYASQLEATGSWAELGA
jgi:predicted pyridoxine 5'-phosphate oxidase superfamily flavin-nucleotide-binding protein